MPDFPLKVAAVSNPNLRSFSGLRKLRHSGDKSLEFTEKNGKLFESLDAAKLFFSDLVWQRLSPHIG